VAIALQKYIEAELGKKDCHKINHLCSTCLKTCLTNRRITKFFGKDELGDVKNILEKSQVWTFKMSICLYLKLTKVTKSFYFGSST
jgi:hypothetical protein